MLPAAVLVFDASSKNPTTERRAVSFMTIIHRLASPGSAKGIIAGIVILTSVWIPDIPKALAASLCPLGTARIAALMTSVEYAPCTNPSTSIPASSPEISTL